MFHFQRITETRLKRTESAAAASSAPTPAPRPTAIATMTYIASLASSSAFRKRTRPAMPARLKATARLSFTMTRMAATAMGSRAMVVTRDWSTFRRSRVAT